MTDDGSLREDTERLPTALAARFDAGGQSCDGIAVNVSRRGLCLRTNTPLAEGQTLDLALLSERGEIRFQGVVRWVVELSPLIEPTFNIEAGIGVEQPTPEYASLFDQESAGFVDYRSTPRIPHQIRVEVAGPGFWESTFALNLGRRGLFLRTDHSLVPGQLVELKMFLPGLDPISVRAEVVHVLSREAAVAVGAEPGVGLRIGVLPAGVRERYLDYVKELEDAYRA